MENCYTNNGFVCKLLHISELNVFKVIFFLGKIVFLTLFSISLQ